jgi:hypothetical protein
MTQETVAQNIKNQLKSSTENEKIVETKSKPMHRQFYLDPERPSVDTEKFLVWLCNSGLKGKTESFIKTAQDQGLNMQYHHRNNMKQPTVSECTTSRRQNIQHIVQGCTTISPSQYTNRHNKMTGCIH